MMSRFPFLILITTACIDSANEPVSVPAQPTQLPRTIEELNSRSMRTFVQRAVGYLATLVAGTAITERSELTGARPGRLVRMGVA